MSIHLHFEESFGEDLEDRFVRRKADVEFALRSIESKSTSHAASDDDDRSLVLLNELVANSDVGASVNFVHVTLGVDVLRLDCIKTKLLVSISR